MDRQKGEQIDFEQNILFEGTLEGAAVMKDPRFPWMVGAYRDDILFFIIRGYGRDTIETRIF